MAWTLMTRSVAAFGDRLEQRLTDRARRRRAVRDPERDARLRKIDARKTAAAAERARLREERQKLAWHKYEPAWRAAPVVTDHGFEGRGGGKFGVVDQIPEYRATTPQLCGIWPWAVAGGVPQVGTPIGRHLDHALDVMFDPISWVYRTPLMNTPSLFLLGLPSLGKSTLGRKLCNGAIAQGQIPLILADLKPDYAKLVEAMGGVVIQIGHGLGYFNPLAVGALGSIIPLLDDFPEEQRRVRAQVLSRRFRLMQGLLELVRRGPLVEHENNLLSKTLRLLEDDPRFSPTTPPLIQDLFDTIQAGPAELRAHVLARTQEEYEAKTDRLLSSLTSLLDGPLGEVFSRQTSKPLDLSGETPPTAVCVDVSAIDTADSALEGAVLLACWEDGFGAVEAAHTLADCGIRPQRHFLVFLDELWRVLGAGPGMVSRVDKMTRLTRTLGTGLVEITHTVKDLESLEAEFDIKKAKGFIERAGAVIVGGLPKQEMVKLCDIVPFTNPEIDMVTSWATPASFDAHSKKKLPPPGRGRFLLKVGTDNTPGIPFQTFLCATERELGYHDTNSRFTGDTKKPTPVPEPTTNGNGGRHAVTASR